jgi:sarcosine oxidase subunit alpha
MSESVDVTVNGQPVCVPAGTVAAAAIALAGATRVRTSVTGSPRGPLCGMGICFECRATVDGRRHSRTCLIPCENGMELRTDE